MRAIDTNVLVRLIVRDDVRQTAIAEAWVAKGAWVSILALTETIWVLASVYEKNVGAQAEAVEMLLNHRELVLQHSETVEAALGLFRNRRGTGFSDCLMLELARKEGHLPLGTFDRSLAKAAGAQKL